MDGKGTGEVITYPNIFFAVDNFEEVRDNMFILMSFLGLPFEINSYVLKSTFEQTRVIDNGNSFLSCAST